MSLQKYLLKLQSRHTELDYEIKSEMVRPLPNFSIISSLKRKKLKVKDMLQKVSDKAILIDARTS